MQNNGIQQYSQYLPEKEMLINSLSSGSILGTVQKHSLSCLSCLWTLVLSHIQLYVYLKRDNTGFNLYSGFWSKRRNFRSGDSKYMLKINWKPHGWFSVISQGNQWNLVLQIPVLDKFQIWQFFSKYSLNKEKNELVGSYSSLITFSLIFAIIIFPLMKKLKEAPLDIKESLELLEREGNHKNQGLHFFLQWDFLHLKLLYLDSFYKIIYCFLCMHSYLFFSALTALWPQGKCFILHFIQ